MRYGDASCYCIKPTHHRRCDVSTDELDQSGECVREIKEMGRESLFFLLHCVSCGSGCRKEEKKTAGQLWGWTLVFDSINSKVKEVSQENDIRNEKEKSILEDGRRCNAFVMDEVFTERDEKDVK